MSTPRPKWVLATVVAVMPLIAQAELLATNLNGWSIILTLNTNGDRPTEKTAATITFSNTTHRLASLGNYTVGGAENPALPSFGELVVFKVAGKDSYPMRYVPSADSGNGLPPIIMGKEITVQVEPTNTVSFTFDLRKHWKLEPDTIYEISFVGAVPAITNRSLNAHFRLGPAVLIITDKSASKLRTKDDR